MDSEQRRKRKRLTTKPLSLYTLSLPLHHFSVRSLTLCFSFVAFIYFLSHRIPTNPSHFKPVLVVQNFPLLSSSSSSSSSINSIQLYPQKKPSSFSLNVEDRVLFPDHVLLIVSSSELGLVKGDELHCIYYVNYGEISSLKMNPFWVDEYNEFQSIVRCPIPPRNYSAEVNLVKKGGKFVDFIDERETSKRNQTVHSWETVAYSATLDGNIVVVFAKGLNLRSNRKSDYTQFSCHFGMGKWGEVGKKFVLRTKAVSAAQEVVRCLLPNSKRLNPRMAEGFRVTIGISPRFHSRRDHGPVLFPSVAKISSPKVGKLMTRKYELCVCSMVWNQASSLREWIMYHAWLGIEKWFIYDNNSDDGTKKVIEELELENFNVSRYVWPWIKTQEAGFSHCALRARNECNWVAFMDVDEFFYFPNPNRRNLKSRKLGFPFPGQSSLRTLVSNFSASDTIGEIRTSCHSFGPSGLNSTPLQGVTVGYTCRLQSPERHKSIMRPDALHPTLLNVVHHFRLRKGFKYMNLPENIAVINHYKYQVWESFRAKFFRRVATYVADWQENHNEGSRDRAPGLGTEAVEPENWNLQFCEIWDTGLRDFVLGNLSDIATGLLPWERNSS